MAHIAAPVPDSFFGNQQGVTPAEGIPSDEIRTHADAAQFGGQIGQSVEKTGNEVGDLATKFASMYSDSAARDGVTKASQQLSDAEMEFKQNKGNNAVTAYKTFQQKVQQIGDTTAQSMPNMMAQKNFKDDFAREANGAIFRSGGYVAEQAESAQTASINASIANNINQFAVNAGNPTRQTYLTNIHDNALQYAQHLGLDGETADKLVSHNTGEAYSAAIRMNINQNPNFAKQLYDEAVNGSITVNRDGKEIQVPYLDAAHRAQVTSEMDGEFRRQFSDQLSSARSYASLGIGYDKDALVSSAQNAGHDQAYINAEMTRLDSLTSKSNQVNTRYTVEKSLDNNRAQAAAGLPLTNIPDEATIRAAYPNEPAKANDVIQDFHDQYRVAGYVGSLPTTPLSQINEKLEAFSPPGETQGVSPLNKKQGGKVPSAGETPGTSDSAISWTMQHEGGYVSNDSGKGPTKYGVNKESNPEVDVENLTPDQAKKVLKDKYWDAVGADKMSPQLAQVAFDTAVNMGVGTAKKLVAEADGDPQKLIDLRRDHYQVLADSNPDKYGKNLDGWNKRLDDLQQTLTPGPDQFADQSRLYQKMIAATQTYVKQLTEDPAGTIVGKDQNLTNMLNTGIKDPSKLGPYIDAINARQDLLEVPEANRAILPANVATSFAAQITSNPAAAPDAISSLEQKTGSYWPQVYHSLVTQGGLPANYQAITHLNDDPSTKKDAYELSRWMAEDTKGKDTSTLVGGAKVETSIKNTIEATPEVQNLIDSLRQSGQSMDQVKGTMDAMNSLAYAKTYYNRDPLAAQNAAAAFTGKYQFMEYGHARVPTTQFDAVNTNAQVLLDNLQKKAVAPSVYQTDQHGTVMKPENYFDWVKNSPTWVTSPNEDALWLKDPQDGWVRDKNGQPLSVQFSEPAPAKLSAAQIGER